MAKSKPTQTAPANPAPSPDDRPAGDLGPPASPEVPPADLPLWRVSIPWVNPMEIEAADEAEAIEAYKGLCSINSTSHPFKVERLK